MPDQVEVKWNEDGLIPVVVQNDESGEVLMLEWMNRDALRLTQETGRAHFWDMARGEIWHPDGENAGIQYVEAVWLDCDGDSLLLTVRTEGPACPTGQESCFYVELPGLMHPHTEEDLPWE